MEDFSTLPNLGKNIDGLLKEAGINTIDEFKKMGCENVFIRIQAIDKDACLHKLYAIEGAMQGVMKKDISKERKDELRQFFSMINK